MKSILLLLLFTFLSVSVFSQIENHFKNKSLKPLKLKPGNKLDIKNNNAPGSTIIVPENDLENVMPVLKFEVKGAFKRNNGMGADVYVYKPDNMPVLKPDATFRSNMPVQAMSIKR